MENPLSSLLQKHRASYHPVVPFDPAADKLYPFDFTDKNSTLTPDDIADTERFANYINRTLMANHCRYGIGGYNEHRTLYGRSGHFDTDRRSPAGGMQQRDAAAVVPEAGNEPRRLHLGIDIWGPAGTKVMSPLDGVVHSFAFNNNDSDYGATLILTYQLDRVGFHVLYGHLSLNSLKNQREGATIRKGQVIGEFGMRFENGNWPPHLHFQLIRDMQGWKGDYPGVCKFSGREQWLENCPDPAELLQMS